MSENKSKDEVIANFNNIINESESLKIEIEEVKSKVDRIYNLITDLENKAKDFEIILNEYTTDNCTDKEISVTSIELNDYSVVLTINETYQLTAIVNPNNATNKIVTWSSSDENIAKVSDTGLVTYLSEGTTTIIATCGNISAKCVIIKKIITDNEYLNLLDVTKAWNKGITGKGIKVAIIEGGILSLDNKFTIKGWFNTITNTYTEDSPSINDSSWYIENHGFGVAGVISGKDTGVAPDCELYSVVVNTGNQDGLAKGVKQGIKWCLSNNIKIINISLENLNVDYELLSLVKEVAAKNIIIVNSIGNNSAVTDNLFACCGSLISVGAINRDKTLSKFSNYGEGMAFVSYGDAVPSYDKNGNLIDFSGTSCAAPLVTGLVALLKQQNSKLSFKEIEYLLMESSEDLGDIGRDDKYGYGLPKAYLIPEVFKTDEEIELIEKDIVIKEMIINMPENMIIGDSYKALVRIKPRILNYLDILISSSNEKLISVDQLTNEVTAIAGGNPSLIFSVAGREYQKSFSVHVLSNLEEKVQSLLESYSIPKVIEAGFTGKGVKVAILSTGVNQVGNIDLVNYGPNYIAFNPTTSTVDDYGTGTVIASVVKSIAPNCELYSIKNQNGGGYSYTNETLQNKSLQWCIDNKMDIVIGKNLLLGVFNSKNKLFKKMNEAGIITLIEQGTGDTATRFAGSNTVDNLYVALLNSDNTPLVTQDIDNIDVTSYYSGFPAYDNTGSLIVTSRSYQGGQLGIVGGICVLLKQQKADLNVTILRALLPKLCTSLGSIKKFGYGILNADIF
jgi:subtilisin family serine protease